MYLKYVNVDNKCDNKPIECVITYALCDIYKVLFAIITKKLKDIFAERKTNVVLLRFDCAINLTEVIVHQHMISI